MARSVPDGWMAAVLAWAASLTAFGLVMAITPGPNNLLLAGSGIGFGLRRTLPLLLGVQVGFAALLLAVAAGLGTVFALVPWLQVVLKVAGSGYLLWLAWHLWRTSSLTGAEADHPLGFSRGITFQAVNAKAWVYGVSVVAGFLTPGAGYVAHVAVAVLLLALVGTFASLVWAGFGAGLRHWLTNPARLLVANRVLAVLTALSIALFWL